MAATSFTRQLLSGVVELFFKDVERKLIAPDVDRVPVLRLMPSVEVLLLLLF